MNKIHIRRFIFKTLKKSKLVFNSWEWMIGFKDVCEQKKIHKKKEKKRLQEIKREIHLVKHYWHCGTFHYWRYGLPYVSLEVDKILDYVPTYYHHKKLERDHDGIDTEYYGNKLVQAFLFKERGIPTGDVVAYNKGKKWFNFSDAHEIDIVSTIENVLKETKEKLFLKPVDGQGGFGIFVLKYDGAEFLVNGEKKYLLEFVQSLPITSFILQKGVLQSKQMMEINPCSVNTIRVVVQKKVDLMKMKTCIIRMGRKGKEVDNSAQGGISVKIDTETGQVASIATAEHGGGIMTCHPDTGKSFGDITIENWQELKTQIESIGTKLIDFKNIALDIAITDEGAKLLEFNFRYGIEHQQCVLGGVRQLLEIYPN